jgi:PAS domain S-box-containing protein
MVLDREQTGGAIVEIARQHDPDDLITMGHRSAAEQLSVAEEEMRVQLEALDEMRMALSAQQLQWRARFDGLPDAFIETDQDDTIVEVNRAAEDLLGRSRGTVIGKPITSLAPDTARRGLRNVITQLRRGSHAAQWSGTLLGTAQSRPEVQVAIAASAEGFNRSVSTDGRTSSGQFVGAR